VRPLVIAVRCEAGWWRAAHDCWARRTAVTGPNLLGNDCPLPAWASTSSRGWFLLEV